MRAHPSERAEQVRPRMDGALRLAVGPSSYGTVRRVALQIDMSIMFLPKPP